MAGLVVLAMGLCKTSLAAFDSANADRVLFVAHREEKLNHAQWVIRTRSPAAT